jgi:hypothetical protein
MGWVEAFRHGLGVSAARLVVSLGDDSGGSSDEGVVVDCWVAG